MHRSITRFTPTLISLILLVTLSFIVINKSHTRESHSFDLHRRGIALDIRQDTGRRSTDQPASTSTTSSTTNTASAATSIVVSTSTSPTSASSPPSSSSSSSSDLSSVSPSSSTISGSVSVTVLSSSIPTSTSNGTSSASSSISSSFSSSSFLTSSFSFSTSTSSSSPSSSSAPSTRIQIASTRSTTTSSSSSTSATSSTKPTSAKATATSTILHESGSTLVVTPTSVNSVPQTSSSDVPLETQVASAASKGFWQNKSAVAGTFTAIGLISVGILAAALALMRKRNRRSLHSEEESYLEKKSEPADSLAESRAPSMINVATHAPTNAYPDREIHYGSTTQYSHDTNTFQHTGVEYPPGTAYAPGDQEGYYQDGVPSGHNAAYHDPDPFVAVNNSYSLASHTRAHPYSMSGNVTGLAPPVAFRQELGRESAYQQSLDSFYGATAS